MLTFVSVIAALIFSVFINAAIKNWVYETIVKPELDDMDEDVEENSTIVYTTLGMVILNNLIPLTLGAAIGLYTIL